MAELVWAVVHLWRLPTTCCNQPILKVFAYIHAGCHVVEEASSTVVPLAEQPFSSICTVFINRQHSSTPYIHVCNNRTLGG